MIYFESSLSEATGADGVATGAEVGKAWGAATGADWTIYCCSTLPIAFSDLITILKSFFSI